MAGGRKPDDLAHLCRFVGEERVRHRVSCVKIDIEEHIIRIEVFGNLGGDFDGEGNRFHVLNVQETNRLSSGYFFGKLNETELILTVQLKRNIIDSNADQSAFTEMLDPSQEMLELK